MYSIDWLGPLVLHKGSAALPLSIKKVQALLVLLACDGPLPRERIVAMLWPTFDESTARRNLRRELARLRAAGAAELIRADGDRLALGAPVEVAARRFQAAVDAGQAEAALALWRGAPADGLQLDDAEPWHEWLAHERRRLEALHAQALALSAAQHEAAGAWTPALERVRTLLAADPLQERHHVHAMRLLDRLGQREAALAQYDACVRLLADELGLQPMAATQALAVALRQAGAVPPAASAPASEPAAPAELLPARLPFVGREREVAWLERAWREGGLLLVEGEGGVGKTRLVSDFAAAHGPYAIVPCRTADAELPLASFARALRALAGPEPTLDGQPDWVRGELARLLPELGPAPRPLRSQEERTRFGHACTLAWRHWAEGNFDAVVIDDWHLADAGSQALWMQVHGAIEPPLRLILVYRPSLAPAAAGLLLREGQSGARPLRLEPLPPEAVFELVQRLSGRAEPKRFAEMLVRATGGNPFYMAETLRHLVERGLLSAGADGRWQTPFDDRTERYDELPLPESVRSAVHARVQRLPERAQRVLEAAALADEPFNAALLAPACALSEVEASLAVEDALQARLLREADGGGLAFAHHLVQQALEAVLDDARRRSVHRRLALGAAAAGAPPARIAAHHEAGGEPRRAVPWRHRAAEEAMRLQALDEAIAQWRQALADGASPDEALVMAPALMKALDKRDFVDQAQAQGDALLDLVQQGVGLEAQRHEAVITVAAMRARRSQALQALALLDGLPALADPRLRALALQARSDAARDLARADEASELARAALALQGLSADERLGLLDSLTIAEFHAGHVQQALQLVEQWLDLAQRSLDPPRVARALCVHGTILVDIGDLAGAESKLKLAARQAAQMGLVGEQRFALFNLCALYSAQSRPDAVLAAATECWNLQPPIPQDRLRTMVRLAFVEAHQALGNLGAAHHWALGAIDDALAIGQTFAATCVAQTGAEMLAVLGESPRLGPLLTLLDRPDAQSVPAARETWIVVAECALISGQPDEARAVRSRIDVINDIENPRVGTRMRILDAALALSAGDAAGAMAGLPGDDATGLNDELRWRALAVRLRAEAATGGCRAATLMAAEAALQQSGVHALAALLLHQALLEVAATDLRRRAWSQRVASLAQTLDDAPELRARFERRWLGAS